MSRCDIDISDPNSILDAIDSKTAEELKDNESRSILFHDSAQSLLDHPNLEKARSKLWFKWSGADIIQQKYPANYASTMMHGENTNFLKNGMRLILDITENEIDKDLSRTFSDSELRERFQVFVLVYFKFQIWLLYSIPYDLT
jgi:hypothetical protein